MQASRLWVTASSIVIATAIFLAAPAAHADTYQIYLLQKAGESITDILYPVGITDSGLVVAFVDPTDCNGTPGHCYETFENGLLVSKSLTDPDLDYDNGTGCIPDAPAGVYISDSVCNNGREIYGIGVDSPPYNGVYYSGIFNGPDLTTDFVAGAINPYFDLNASGDFAYISGDVGGSDGALYEAIDLTTRQAPEPSSIYLFGTGLFAAAGIMRRRIFP
jgi:hypothetical protein